MVILIKNNRYLFGKYYFSWIYFSFISITPQVHDSVHIKKPAWFISQRTKKIWVSNTQHKHTHAHTCVRAHNHTYKDKALENIWQNQTLQSVEISSSFLHLDVFILCRKEYLWNFCKPCFPFPQNHSSLASHCWIFISSKDTSQTQRSSPSVSNAYIVTLK